LKMNRGDYWEEPDEEEEDEEEDEEMYDDDIVEDTKFASDAEENEETKIDKRFERQVLSGEHVVVMNSLRYIDAYYDRMRRHKRGNTSEGLFDLLIIAELEYQRDWEEPKEPYWCVFTRTPTIINDVTAYNRDLRDIKITTPEKMLKNIQHIQKNLELMECKIFKIIWN
jgi:hypothetical protein